MPMQETLELVRDTLEAGMTTGVGDSEDYYVKTWHIGSQMKWRPKDMPLALIKPEEEHRVDQYVQEDTEVDTVVVSFFPIAIRRATDDAVYDANDKTVAMVDRATMILRRDPTLGHEIYDGQIVSSLFRQPGYIDQGATIHTAELRFQAKRRSPWQ